MSIPVIVDGERFDSKTNAAKAIHSILISRINYKHGCKGIYQDLVKLDRGFKGYVRGIYIEIL